MLLTKRFTRKKYDNSFPTNTIEWLKNPHEDWEFAAFYEETTYNRFKSDIRKHTRARPVLVDHHEAHAMSSILMTDWYECAVMVVDTVGNKFSTSLGVYENGQITWLKRFRYRILLVYFILVLLVFWDLSLYQTNPKSWLQLLTESLNGLIL